jgi:thiamine pyrophosphate-dependent acetolactate synthase large subunit-like protein
MSVRAHRLHLKPGTSSIIYDGCGDEGVPIIDVCHERVTAHAAHGYARQATRNAMMDAQKAAT